MRHHARLRLLLPALASLVSACGGGVQADGTTTSSSGTSGASASSGQPGPSTSSSSSGAMGTSSGTSGTSDPFDAGAYDFGAPQSTSPCVFDGVTLAAHVDYLELRLRSAGAPSSVLGRTGNLCARAPSAASCLASFQQNLAATGGWTRVDVDPTQTSFAVATTTAGPLTIDTVEDLARAVAPVDTPHDAALLATAVGASVACPLDVVADGDGYLVKTQGRATYGAGIDCYTTWDRTDRVARDGSVTTGTPTMTGPGTCPAPGRRPEGLVPRERASGREPLGDYFAEAAHLEAASVISFERLAAELATLGAPAELVATALGSRDDEVRHARMTTKMARRFGAEPSEPRVEAHHARSPLAIALENATEGCVNETYAALLAHRQAIAASDPSIRAMMAVIAEDETRHAGLAWDVAAWLEPQLTLDERVMVEDARRRAIADLRRELAAEIHPDLNTRAGLPDPATALTMLDALDQRFLAAA